MFALVHAAHTSDGSDPEWCGVIYQGPGPPSVFLSGQCEVCIWDQEEGGLCAAEEDEGFNAKHPGQSQIPFA